LCDIRKGTDEIEKKNIGRNKYFQRREKIKRKMEKRGALICMLKLH
jgi:hypothetical protein